MKQRLFLLILATFFRSIIMHLKNILFLSLCFSFCSGIWGSELKIAVVDEQQVIDEYSRSKQLVKQLEEAFKARKGELQALEADIEKANRELRTASDSKKQELFQKISKGKIELDVSKKYMTEFFTSQQNRFTLEVIKDIEDAIAVVGRDGGYDLVLRKTVPGPRGLDAQKTVFYHSERLDITQQVLKFLNVKFSQASKP
jgi:Skp family chaperone for outer membrane proteins